MINLQDIHNTIWTSMAREIRLDFYCDNRVKLSSEVIRGLKKVPRIDDKELFGLKEYD